MPWSIRTDKKLVAEYKQACKNLPISLKPTQLLHSYMQSIIDASKLYNLTGSVKLGYIVGDTNVIIYNTEGTQRAFEFGETE
jgi:hypothetical protein